MSSRAKKKRLWQEQHPEVYLGPIKLPEWFCQMCGHQSTQYTCTNCGSLPTVCLDGYDYPNVRTPPRSR